MLKRVKKISTTLINNIPSTTIYYKPKYECSLAQLCEWLLSQQPIWSWGYITIKNTDYKLYYRAKRASLSSIPPHILSKNVKSVKAIMEWYRDDFEIKLEEKLKWNLKTKSITATATN